MELSAKLDQDIALLRSRINKLAKYRSHLRSTLLSAEGPSCLADVRSSTLLPNARRARIAEAVAQQTKHNLTTNYRLVAGVTSFLVRDPDPYAEDGGRVLGLRIEVPRGARFRTPYFVHLVRVRDRAGPPGLEAQNEQPEHSQTRFKVTHHTVPDVIRLPTLVRRYLPLKNEKGAITRQDLQAFARALRKEIVSWHLRQDALSNLRKEAHLDKLEDSEDESEDELAISQDKPPTNSSGIVDITADLQIQHIDIRWASGAGARLRVAPGGQIEKAAVRGGVESGRLRRAILGGDGRIEGLLERIQEATRQS